MQNRQIDGHGLYLSLLAGLAVYDSAAENNIRGKYTLYPELVRALEAHLPPIDAFDRIPGSAGALPRLG